MKKIFFNLLALLIVASFSLVACGGGAPTEPPPATREPVVTEAPVNEVVKDIPLGGSLEVRTDNAMHLINFTQVISNEGEPITVVLNDFQLQNLGHFPIDYNGNFLDLGWIEIVPPVLKNSVWTVRMHLYQEELKRWMGPMPSVVTEASNQATYDPNDLAVLEFPISGEPLSVTIPVVTLNKEYTFYIYFYDIDENKSVGLFNDYWLSSGDSFPVEIDGAYYRIGWIEFYKGSLPQARWRATLHVQPLSLWTGPLPSAYSSDSPTSESPAMDDRCTIELKSPINSNVKKGDVVHISWDASEGVDTINISLRVGPSKSTGIDVAVVENTSYYDWTVDTGFSDYPDFQIVLLAYDSGITQCSTRSDVILVTQ